MARRTSPTLTEAGLGIMEALWARGPSTVRQVVAALPSPRPKAYNTVLTLLRILEQKGYVGHTQEGRAHVYRTTVSCREARRQALHHLLTRFSEDSPELLVAHLFEEHELGPSPRNRRSDQGGTEPAGPTEGA